MTHLGLFEGIGGFSLAARWAGWETIAWCEWDKNCQRVLKHHFPNAIPHGDITKTDFTGYAGRVGVLTGGFPCQPYSSAGKRLGKEDDRHLWPEMLRAVREIAPRWVVGENVRGLVSWNGGMVFDEVQADLEAEGYEVFPFILPASGVNAPHERYRVWFVAFNSKFKPNGGHNTGTSSGTWMEMERNKLDKAKWIESPNNTKPSSFNDSNATSNRRNREGQKIETKEGLQQRPEPAGKLAGRPEGLCSNGNAAYPNGFGLRGESYGLRDSKFFSENSKGYDWANFPTQSPVCGGNDGLPRKLDAITFPKWREFAIGAYGNAIVPQVAYQIFKAINDYEKTHNNSGSGSHRRNAAEGRSGCREKPGDPRRAGH